MGGINLVYVETETKLLRSIEPSAVCYENQIGQRHDRLYRWGPC